MPITDACTCCGGSRCGGVQCDKTCHMLKVGSRCGGQMHALVVVAHVVVEGSVTKHATCPKGMENGVME